MRLSNIPSHTKLPLSVLSNRRRKLITLMYFFGAGFIVAEGKGFENDEAVEYGKQCSFLL